MLRMEEDDAAGNRQAGAALGAVERLCAAARRAVARRVAPDGAIDPVAFEREQHAAHGLAWLEVHAEALRRLAAWGQRLEADGSLGEVERLTLDAGLALYLGRIAGGMAMGPSEAVRLEELLGEDPAADAFRTDPAVRRLIAHGSDIGLMARLGARLAAGETPDPGYFDDTLSMVADQFARFSDDEVRPLAGGWHEHDSLIPLELIGRLAGLGVFGLGLPEELGGLGMGKEAMCIVTEELSRGSLALGSLSTRSEIAGELIRLGGTAEQKAAFLPGIADGSILPTAVFTEPDTGSDLASLATRAELVDGMWRVTGAKTWITHAARADLMTILCRTDPSAPGYKGLSMLLARKPRGTDDDPFPVAGLTGSEIPVLGYRGMKEYALSFDGFAVPAENLLGGVQGQGFKQLMATFESARIQTAARAIGVARCAFELGLAYAQERRQFGKPLIAFPRIANKLSLMAIEILVARQLTLHAARRKDTGRRCDLEAGLAKLHAAKAAWVCADDALQIHGGNGYALEYPISRVLCDSRILSIFEGAAEIQAQVIARRLLAE